MSPGGAGAMTRSRPLRPPRSCRPRDCCCCTELERCARMLKRHIKAIGHARERLSEPLLTMLTIVMAALMFIIMPIHAAGLLKTQTVGFGVLIIFITGVVMLSGSLSAALAMGAALALGFASWILRQSGPSTIDVYLDATAYIIVAFALALIVCRAVFGPGPVTYHHISFRSLDFRPFIDVEKPACDGHFHAYCLSVGFRGFDFRWC